MAAVFLASFFISAQEEVVVKGKVVYSKSMVDANLKTIKDIVKDGNKMGGGTREVQSSQIYGFIYQMNYFANYAEIEKVTGYSRDWFSAMKKTLEEMWIPKSKMETAVLNKNEKIVAQYEPVYKAAHKKFLDLLDHPQKAQKKK